MSEAINEIWNNGAQHKPKRKETLRFTFKQKCHEQKLQIGHHCLEQGERKKTTRTTATQSQQYSEVYH